MWWDAAGLFSGYGVSPVGVSLAAVVLDEVMLEDVVLEDVVLELGASGAGSGSLGASKVALPAGAGGFGGSHPAEIERAASAINPRTNLLSDFISVAPMWVASFQSSVRVLFAMDFKCTTLPHRLCQRLPGGRPFNQWLHDNRYQPNPIVPFWALCTSGVGSDLGLLRCPPREIARAHRCYPSIASQLIPADSPLFGTSQ